MESTRELALWCAECGVECAIPATRQQGSAVAQIRAFGNDHRDCRRDVELLVRIPNQRDIVRAIR